MLNPIQLLSIEQSILSIREVAMAILTDDSVDLVKMVSLLNDRCTDIETELYCTEEASLRDELIAWEYAEAGRRLDSDEFTVLCDEEAIENYVAGLTDNQVELALQIKSL